MDLVIDVTADDIAQNERRSQCFCALARATCRALGVPPGAVKVDNYRIELPGGGRAALPLDAQVAVRLLDGGHTVEPFSFPLEAPRFI